MGLTIAIQPDYMRHRNGKEQSFSTRWCELAAQAGVSVRLVNVYAADIVDQIAGCDGFMWRPPVSTTNRELSRHLLPAIEAGLRIPVFPSWNTLWHSEDKLAQCYLLRAAGLPMPRTWVFWRLDDAIAFCRSAEYPLVMKLSEGIQSNGVQLLHNVDEALYWARRMFTIGATGFDKASPIERALAGPLQGLKLVTGRPIPAGLQHHYFYVQEFLPGNDFDTRITVIGDRAFAFRRWNRPNDFRASGSGRIDWDPRSIDLNLVRLALRTAQSLGTQSLGLDLLYRDGQPVVCETTYAYASWAVRDCPGHWVLNGDPEDGDLVWRDGHLAPDDAIFEDFLALVRAKSPMARPPCLEASAVMI